jgi:hypothetical protein
MKALRFVPLVGLAFLLSLAGFLASWPGLGSGGREVAVASDTGNLVPNGDFELGNLTWWTQSGNGRVTTVPEGSCFSANDTTGIALHGNFAINVRSGVPGQPTEIGTVTSYSFPAGSAISFYALSENSDANPVPDPVMLEVRVLDETDTTLLAQQVTTNVVTLSPNCGSEPRDGNFSYHTIDTSAYLGQSVKVQFRQHTNTSGAGWFTLLDDVSVIGGEPIATPTPGPFTPTYAETADEIAADDPYSEPPGDECPVSGPCKTLHIQDIPTGQPWGNMFIQVPASIVSFATDEIVPDGAIVGRGYGSVRITEWGIGPCDYTGTDEPYDWLWFDATTDPATTTGSPSDLYSSSNWPVQLNAFRDAIQAGFPGAVLHSRWVKQSPGWAINVLWFRLLDGSIISSPDIQLPEQEACAPFIIRSLYLGLSADNPATPGNEGGIPLFTCSTPGTQTYRLILDRIDTPPGDLVVLEDTITCSSNTPAGSGVSVPLNGGTQALAGIELTFSSVDSGGTTNVVTTTTGPPPPTGFKIVGLAELPLYFDINTDASYSGDLTVCVRYDETQVEGSESALRLMQRVDDSYVDLTTSVDTAANVVCGVTAHLSIFVVAGPSAAVGGIIQLQPDPSAPSPHKSDSAVLYYIALATAAAAAIAIATGAWYARRRFSHGLIPPRRRLR